jgi:hypothetical protein
MKQIFTFMSLCIVVFSIFGVGSEIYKAVVLKSDIESRMYSTSIDALELYADDSLRMDHLSYFDRDAAEIFVVDEMKRIYGLDDTLKSAYDGAMISAIDISYIECNSGSYGVSEEEDIAHMIETPSIHIKGDIIIVYKMFGFERAYRVPFHVDAENTRRDI